MDDEDDEWIGECLLVAGFITGIVVITLCISVYYICCHCPRQANRRKAKHAQQRRLREPSVASTAVESHESCHETGYQPDGDTATQQFPSLVTMATQNNVESAPPPYYISEDDPPPPYSIDDTSTEIITEVWYIRKPALLRM